MSEHAPDLRKLRSYFNSVIDCAVKLYASIGPPVSNPDYSAVHKANSFLITEFSADLDNAIAYAVRHHPHLEVALYSIIRQRAGLGDPTVPDISRAIYNAVVKQVTPVLIDRKLAPWLYFNKSRARFQR